MRSSVRALLHQIVDYAGLFPPAKLALDVSALGNRQVARAQHRGQRHLRRSKTHHHERAGQYYLPSCQNRRTE